MAKVVLVVLIAIFGTVDLVSAANPAVACAETHFGKYDKAEVSWSALEPRLNAGEEGPSCYAECVLKRINVLEERRIKISTLRNTGVDIDDRLDQAAAGCRIAGAGGKCGEGREAALCLCKALDRPNERFRVRDKYSSDTGLGAALKQLILTS